MVLIVTFFCSCAGCAWMGRTAGKVQGKVERKIDSLESGYRQGYEQENAVKKQ